jgi:class 3 adenylate cyclase
VEPSEEIRRVVIRIDALRDGDEEAVSNRISRQPIRVRIGLHVGETVHEGDHHFGHAVNYAARVASAAPGGEIVASSLVHGLVAQTGEFEFQPVREVDLKGVEGLQKVYPLAAAVG